LAGDLITTGAGVFLRVLDMVIVGEGSVRCTGTGAAADSAGADVVAGECVSVESSSVWDTEVGLFLATFFERMDDLALRGATLSLSAGCAVLAATGCDE
jgi:hypothetical protein